MLLNGFEFRVSKLLRVGGEGEDGADLTWAAKDLVEYADIESVMEAVALCLPCALYISEHCLAAASRMLAERDRLGHGDCARTATGVAVGLTAGALSCVSACPSLCLI